MFANISERASAVNCDTSKHLSWKKMLVRQSIDAAYRSANFVYAAYTAVVFPCRRDVSAATKLSRMNAMSCKLV